MARDLTKVVPGIYALGRFTISKFDKEWIIEPGGRRAPTLQTAAKWIRTQEPHKNRSEALMRESPHP